MLNPFKREEKELDTPKEEIKVEVKAKEAREPLYATILKDYGGLESNIPVNHQYWQIRP